MGFRVPPKDNGKENGNYIVYWGYIGLHGDIVPLSRKNYRGLYRDNGKENALNFVAVEQLTASHI